MSTTRLSSVGAAALHHAVFAVRGSAPHSVARLRLTLSHATVSNFENQALTGERRKPFPLEAD